MSHTLVYRAKPNCNPSILISTSSMLEQTYAKTYRSCSNLIDAMFKGAFIQKRRLHIKGNKYMYIPSDTYRMIRVKYFGQ